MSRRKGATVNIVTKISWILTGQILYHMTSVTFVFISLFIAIGGLILVNIANRRETRARLIKVKVAQIKRKIQEMEEFCLSLEPLLDTAAIPGVINDEIIATIEGVKDFSDTQLLDVYRENALSRRESWSKGQDRVPLYRAQDSDAKMARALYYLNEASQILRNLQSKGLLESTALQEMLDDLSWSHLMVKVVTHVIEGQKVQQNGNLGKALAFYKKAQQIAIETSIADARRQQLIADLGALLDNQGKVFDSQLIPEFTHEQI